MFQVHRFLTVLIIFCLMITFALATSDPETVARRIHQKVLTVDTHTDTPMRMADSTWDIGVRHEPGVRGSGQVDLPRMRQGGMDAIFFAAFVAQRDRTLESEKWAFDQANTMIALIKKMCDKYPMQIALGLTPQDAYHHEKSGLMTAFIGMENGFPIGKDIRNVEFFYNQGVRYITLCHTRNNDICDSSTDENGPCHQGLSEFGEQVVGEMNRLGMMVDVSHISDAAFSDVLKISKAPVIASHSCARALCDNPRNLTDEMLRALAKNGGVMQMCILSEYVKTPTPNPARDRALDSLRQKYGSWENLTSDSLRNEYRKGYYAIYEKYPREKATVSDVVDHIDHVVKVVGVDYVGIGTDFDGGGGVQGCNDVSEMPNITLELVKRGYSEKDIAKIWGGNVMRVFRQVEKVAGKIKSEKNRSAN